MAPTKTKKKPASGDALDAPSVPPAAPVLSKEQQCFLQALLARGVIEVTKAEKMYRCARRIIDGESIIIVSSARMCLLFLAMRRARSICLWK
jgi:hypothetical protein